MTIRPRPHSALLASASNSSKQKPSRATQPPNKFWKSCWMTHPKIALNQSPHGRPQTTKRPATSSSSRQSHTRHHCSVQPQQELPGYVKLQRGLLSTVHPPPAAAE